MTAQAAISAAPPDATTSSDRLEQAGLLAMFGVVIALQFSIAAAQSLLAIAVVCWLGLVLSRRERVAVPRFFWPLAALAALTLVSAAASPDPRAGFEDSRQLLLFVLVPVTLRLVPSQRSGAMVTAIVTAGAISAAFGIFQYGILNYDTLDLRVRGSLGHWMTYSGLLTLVFGIALARVLFGERDRLWAALVMPALVIAIALTFTRTAMVAACATAAILFVLRDLRLVALLPVVAAIFFAVAPDRVTQRFMSTFDLNDPTVRDRVAMMSAGERMVRAHPFTGVGPTMVERRYEEYRDPRAVEAQVAHLHNVPLQIAAERGLPALAAWLVFVAIALIEITRQFYVQADRTVPAAALAAMVSMLSGGMFEHNFGDSEVLMLLLVAISLPFAAPRPADPHA
jgi:O-antigen ligase